MKHFWLCAGALVAASTALAGEDLGIRNDTTQGRQLLKAARPQYPREEEGRWTPSCVSFFFSVRPDGKTDRFVVLEAPQYMHADQVTVQTEAEKDYAKRRDRAFIQNDLDALYRWEYARGSKATEEIAVFDFKRSEMGGRLMNLDVRREDLGTKDLRGCGGALDANAVRGIVEKARGKAG